MQIKSEQDEPLHLTYCTNVHPGDSLEHAVKVLSQYAPLAHAKAPEGCKHMPVAWGLFLGRNALNHIDGDPTSVTTLANALTKNRAHALTMNAFPMAGFQDEVVKQRVYRPDWHDAARVRHTIRAARLLAQLPTASSYQSISTMPGSFKAFGAADLPQIVHHLAQVAQELSRIKAETGRQIILAVEPEPGCTFETIDEWVRFFEDHLIPAAASRTKGHERIEDSAVREHIGTCYDCCHQSVEYEDPVAALGKLKSAGISIAKVQLSTALRLEEPARNPDALRRLSTFDEPKYLHQVGACNRHGDIEMFNDLSEYLEQAIERDDQSCRVHFHVPIFESGLSDGLATTRPDLEAILQEIRRGSVTEHAEIETYSFDVLPTGPDRSETLSLGECLSREYSFALDQLTT